MSFKALPVEILDHILGFLQSNKGTLKACSKSHPSLSRLAERHLYANVIIDIQDGSSDDFRKVLHDHPHVADYVRTLSIAFDNHSRYMQAFLEGIAVFLPKFSKLRSIGLCNEDLLIDWASLTEKFRVVFLDCLRLPSLADVRMHNINFPLSTLSPCKHIRNLTLRGCATSTAAGSDDTCLPTIDSLALHDCTTDFLSTIISWTPWRHLSSLTLSGRRLGDSCLKLLPRILVYCSHSLTSLDVNIRDSYNSYYDFLVLEPLIATVHPSNTIPIPLSDLLNLQQLTIQAQLYCLKLQGSFGFHSPIFAIADILRPPSSLKRLTLDFSFLIMPPNYLGAQDKVAEVLCTALHSLLVESASPTGPINLLIKSFPIEAILSTSADHPDLNPFVESGKLILTPGRLSLTPVMDRK